MVADELDETSVDHFIYFEPQNHAQLYPTLARIALDVLPSQASSVPCERLFLGMKQIATDRRASLGSVVFEELTIMKSVWGPKIYDQAAWNSSDIETYLHDFEELLVEEDNLLEWEKDVGGDSDV